MEVVVYKELGNHQYDDMDRSHQHEWHYRNDKIVGLEIRQKTVGGQTVGLEQGHDLNGGAKKYHPI